jgi:hypothetical protein
MKQLRDKPDWGRDLKEDQRDGLIMSYRFENRQMPLGFFERLVCLAAATISTSTRRSKKQLQVTGLYRDAADLYIEGFSYRLILDEIENKIDVRVKERKGAHRVRIHLSIIVRMLQDIFSTTRRSDSFVDTGTSNRMDSATEDDEQKIDEYNSDWTMSSEGYELWPKLILFPNHMIFTDKFSQIFFMADSDDVEGCMLNDAKKIKNIPITAFNHWYNDEDIDNFEEPEHDTTMLEKNDTTKTSIQNTSFKLSKPLKWHVFLSHMQQNGDGIAHVLQLILAKQNMKCWRDMCEDATQKGMEDGIVGSSALLLVLTAGVLTRPYCRFEIRLAVAMNIPIITIKEENRNRPGFCDYNQLKKECPPDLLDHVLTNVEWIPFRRKQYEVEGMAKRIEEEVRRKVTEYKSASRSVMEIENLKSSEVYKKAFQLLDIELERKNVKPRPKHSEYNTTVQIQQKSPVQQNLVVASPSRTSPDSLRKGRSISSSLHVPVNSTSIVVEPHHGTPANAFTRTSSRSSKALSEISSFSLSKGGIPIKEWLEDFRTGFGIYSQIFVDQGIEFHDLLPDLDDEVLNDILNALKNTNVPKIRIKAIKKRLMKFIKTEDDVQEEVNVQLQNSISG